GSSLEASGAIAFADRWTDPPTLRRVRFMTPQEKELLQKFLAQLRQAQVSVKDSEAQAMINSAVAQQPDAIYLLVQRGAATRALVAAGETRPPTAARAEGRRRQRPPFLD